MRAESRIYPFCNRLAAAWAKCPDMRFWQFLVNGYTSKRDPFFVEDDEAIAMIEAAAEHFSPYYKEEVWTDVQVTDRVGLHGTDQ